jgi:putative oxygen-independent coproporphyrinogen III oxidase
VDSGNKNPKSEYRNSKQIRNPNVRMTKTRPALGAYVHVPFCLSKCRYCDFYSITQRERIPEYLSGLRSELDLTPPWTDPADTLYLGGGTPSLLTPSQAGDIVDGITRKLNLDPLAEIALEVNPATVTDGNLREYAAVGFNRLNIGVQSFNDAHLSFLGRRHNAAQARTLLESARRVGFSNIGIDLIYGLPHQTTDTWKEDLRQAVGVGPQHIACYLLSYEPHTPLEVDRRSGRVHALSDRRSADLFRVTHNVLEAAGYEHYEISNFALGPDRRSRHNQKYWNDCPYIGLGPAAHSYNGATRCWNHADLDIYLADLKQGKPPRGGMEHLTAEQRMMEALYLGLRQSDGIDRDRFRTRFQVDFESCFKSALERFSAQGWVANDAQRCRLTVEGMLFLDRIVGELVELID